MTKKKLLRKELIEWGLMLGIPAILYLGGWHTEVLGRIQQGFLYLGIIRPETELTENEVEKADYNLHMISMDHQPLDFEKLKGKVVFMNFWATWCPPCIAEMPNIHNLYKKMGDEVVFVMVNLDEDYQKAKRFLEKKDYTFPVYRLSGPLPKAYYSASIPTTFVLSPKGEIVAKKQGMADYDNKEFRDFLKELSQSKKATTL